VFCVRTDLFLHPDEHSLAIRCPSSSRSDGLVTCPNGISTGLRLASLSLPYTHICIFIDLSCHVVCFLLADFSRDFSILCIFLLIPWYLQYLPFFFYVFLLFIILEFFLILCTKILLCLCVGLILIYLGHLDYDLCFCNT
jgi:hypothetical protein